MPPLNPEQFPWTERDTETEKRRASLETDLHRRMRALSPHITHEASEGRVGLVTVPVVYQAESQRGNQYTRAWLAAGSMRNAIQLVTEEAEKYGGGSLEPLPHSGRIHCWAPEDETIHYVATRNDRPTDEEKIEFLGTALDTVALIENQVLMPEPKPKHTPIQIA